jgi:hypothetical protein
MRAWSVGEGWCWISRTVIPSASRDADHLVAGCRSARALRDSYGSNDDVRDRFGAIPWLTSAAQGSLAGCEHNPIALDLDGRADCIHRVAARGDCEATTSLGSVEQAHALR